MKKRTKKMSIKALNDKTFFNEEVPEGFKCGWTNDSKPTVFCHWPIKHGKYVFKGCEQPASNLNEAKKFILSCIKMYQENN